MKVKTFPTEKLINFTVESSVPIQINLRQGKQNQIQCVKIQCIELNATGRRLLCEFYIESESTPVLRRKIYREHFIRACEKFNVDFPYDE